MQTTIQRKIKTLEKKSGRYRKRKPSPEQEAKNREFMRTVCQCAGGKNGRVVQIWAKHTDTATGKEYFGPVAFFDDDSLDAHLSKTWERSYLTASKGREMYFTVNKFYPWKCGQTADIKDSTRCAYADVVYVDIDAHQDTPSIAMLGDAKQVIIAAAEAHRLPECSITATGRGFGVFVLIGAYNPNSEAAREKYKALGEALAHRVEHELRAFSKFLTIDPAVIGDVSRVARIPGTYNITARAYCAAVRVSGYRYQEDELAAELGITLHDMTVHALPTMAAAYQGAEVERLTAYAAEHPIERGRRYTYIWTVAECLLRDHHEATDEDAARLDAVNMALPEPLGADELRHALKVAEKAAKNGKLPRGETIAERLGLTDAERVRYGLGDGHRGGKPLAGPRVSVPVESVTGLLREALAKPTLPEQYAALEQVQPLLTPALRAEIAKADGDLYGVLLAREKKQLARVFAETYKRAKVLYASAGDEAAEAAAKEELDKLRQEHKSNATRDAQRAERKAAKADKWQQLQELKAAGRTQTEIAAQLGVSLRTVKRHWKD
jgi:DNA-binding CsgD family transcriptional regulator